MAPKMKKGGAKAKSKADVKKDMALKSKEEIKATKRRLNRRDTDAQVERVFEDVLTDLTDRERDVITDEEGRTCRAYLRMIKRSCKLEGGRIGAQWLALARQKFKKEGSKQGDFQIKDHNVDARAEFCRVLTLATLANPTQRKRPALYSYLKFCKGLNQTEMVGLCRSIVDLNCVSGYANSKHVVAILKFMVQNKINEEYPQEFGLLKSQFDQALTTIFAKQRGKKTENAKKWYGNMRSLCAMVTDVAKLDHIFSHEKDLSEVSEDITTALQSCKLCKAMFSEANQHIVVGQFMQQCAAIMTGLKEKNGGEAAIVEAKASLLELAVNAKQKMGNHAYKLKLNVQYRDEVSIQEKVDDFVIYIDYTLNIYLRGLMAGVQDGVPELFFEEGILSTPNKNGKCEVPSNIRDEIKQGRDAINDLIRDANVSSAKDILDVLEVNWEDLIFHDSALIIDKWILVSLMASGGLQLLQSQVRRVLPTRDSNDKITITSVLDAFTGIQKGRLFGFVSDEVKGKVRASMTIVSDLKRAEITNAKLASYQGFDAEVSSSLQWFLRYSELPTGGKKGSGKTSGATVKGEPAIHKMMSAAKAAAVRSAEMVEPLSQFAYMLKESDQVLVQEWAKGVLSHVAVEAACKKSKKAGKTDQPIKTDLELTSEMVANFFK